MNRWDGVFDRRKPDGKPYDPDDVPIGLPGDKAVSSEWELWRYIGKGLLLFVLGAFLLTNAMYGFFEVLVWLAEGG
ncbi:MAG TPA: hypothetical protein VJB57_20650 [Dehalococcoidia bacterium]|nr:hypothetical protein [Dehalococcoidia bacterium]